jgi:hypothetical protein
VAEYGPYNWGKGQQHSFVNNQLNNLLNFEITGNQLMEPYIDFSCFWNTRWINDKNGKENGYDALDKNGNLQANGQGLMIWGNYHGDRMVRVRLYADSIQAFASYKPDENRLFVYLLNKGNGNADVMIDLSGFTVKQAHQVCELRGKDLEDQKPAWENVSRKVTGKSQKLPGATIRVIEYILSDRS